MKVTFFHIVKPTYAYLIMFSLCLLKLNYSAQNTKNSFSHKDYQLKKEEFNKYISSSYYFTTIGKYDSSLIFCNKAFDIALNLKDTSLLANAYNAKGILYEKKGMLAEALDIMFDCINLNKSIKNKLGVAYSYGNISHIYILQNNLDGALECIMKCKSELEKIPGQEIQITTTYNNLGDIYLKKGKPREALSNFKKAMNIALKIKSDEMIVYTKGLIARAYFEMGDYDLAISYLAEVVPLKERQKDKVSLAYSYFDFASTHLKKKNFMEAKKYAEKCLEVGQQIKSLEVRQKALHVLSEIAEHENKINLAFAYFKEYTQLKDSLYNMESALKITQSKLQFEYDAKTAKIKAEQEKKDIFIKQENHKKKIIISVVSVSLILMLILIGFIFKAYQSKHKLNKELELTNKLIQVQKLEVEEQKQKIEVHQNAIIDSINYAKKIQEAMLPSDSYLKKHIKHKKP